MTTPEVIPTAMIQLARDSIHGPSFDCEGAFSWTEQAICSDPVAVELDVEMAERWQVALALLKFWMLWHRPQWSYDRSLQHYIQHK